MDFGDDVDNNFNNDLENYFTMILRMILFMFRRNWTSRLNSQAAQTVGSKVGAENEAKLGGEKH